MSTFDEKLSVTALLKLAGGKKPTPSGRRAMLEHGYINTDDEITEKAKALLKELKR